MPDTVLFVDDEEHVLNSLNRLFCDLDMRVLNASSADDALDLFDKEEIAVIVSDNHMPGMRGIDLLSRVRDISPDTMKILMTAHADLSVAVNAINRGEVFRFIIKPWDNDDLLHTVQEAVGRYNFVQSLKQSDETTLLSLARTIELKDPYTRGHSESVAAYALMIAEALHLSDESINHLKYGSWLHDCGKIGVPEHILNKNGSLDEEEYALIKNHPRWGAEVARQAQMPEQVIKIILHHHERHEGGGYPSGIKGEGLPVEVQIVTVADVYDALTSNRPYRSKYEEEKAIKVMKAMSGSVFDPEVLDVFLYECLPKVILNSTG